VQATTELEQPRLILVGVGGMAMLVLSIALTLLPGGLTLLTSFGHVVRSWARG